MTAAEFERDVQQVADQWAYVQWVVTVDKTDYAVKLRLHVDAECFIQVYANVQKGLISFTLVLNRMRIYGRDCEGGVWIVIRMTTRKRTTFPPKVAGPSHWRTFWPKHSRFSKLKGFCRRASCKP